MSDTTGDWDYDFYDAMEDMALQRLRDQDEMSDEETDSDESSHEQCIRMHTVNGLLPIAVNDPPRIFLL